MTPSGHYLNGQWVVGEGRSFHAINPATGERLWEGSEATEAEVYLAYQGAQSAQASWSRLSVSSRADHLIAFSNQVDKRKSALATQISLETGKPLWESLTEVNSIITKVGLSISAYQERCAEINKPTAEARNRLRYKPLGVVAVLGPFNFPAHLSNGHIVPALLAGNTVIYKPSELTPGVAALMMQCWHESQLPAGVLQCVQGGASTAKTLLNCDVQGVFFTGSSATGFLINAQFSHRPEVLLALEMGGNNPLIIEEVNNRKAAIYSTLLSTLLSAGQRCTCARRIMIPDSAFGDVFLEALISAYQAIKIGAFTETPEPFMGPVIRYEHALSHLKAQQALLSSGGQSLLEMVSLAENTGFLSPGIIDMSNVPNPVDKELFAPLIQVYRTQDFEHALSIAGQTRYGLIAGLLSDHENHYEHMVQTLKTGLTSWNRPTTGASSALPFGGVGLSGNHRPSAYFAADYCAFPIASTESPSLNLPTTLLPGVGINS